MRLQLCVLGSCKNSAGQRAGVYDGSTGLHRAIVVSDGHYGDSSSVAQLCEKVGMPIIIQNIDIWKWNLEFHSGNL